MKPTVNESSADDERGVQRSLIVLDRDGVINRESATFIKSPEEFIVLPGSATAIEQLNSAGYRVVIATNQSGVGRGLFSVDTLKEIHDKLSTIVQKAGGRLDAIYYCPHHPDENCECRKPKVGLLRQIAEAYQCSAAELIVVGDSLRDLEAAWSFGSPAILVRTGNGRTTETTLPAGRCVEIFEDLAEVANHLTA